MRVHDSQAYRRMDVTWERISSILELREILLSFQTSFNLVNAAVVCSVTDEGSKPENHHTVEENSLWARENHYQPRRKNDMHPMSKTIGYMKKT